MSESLDFVLSAGENDYRQSYYARPGLNLSKYVLEEVVENLRQTLSGPQEALQSTQPIEHTPVSSREAVLELDEFIRPSAEVREQAKTIFWEEINIRRETQFARHKPCDLDFAGVMIDWLLFSDYHKPQPDDSRALDYFYMDGEFKDDVLIKNEKKALEDVYRSVLSADSYIWQLYSGSFDGATFDKKFKAIITSMPSYQALASLTGLQDPDRQIRSLTDIEKTVLAAVATTTVRRRFGLESHEPIVYGTPEGRSLCKALYDIDEQQIKDQVDADTIVDPYVRARLVIEGLVDIENTFGIPTKEDFDNGWTNLNDNDYEFRGSDLVAKISPPEQLIRMTYAATGFIMKAIRSIYAAQFYPDHTRGLYDRYVLADPIESTLSEYKASLTRRDKRGGVRNFTFAEVAKAEMLHTFWPNGFPVSFDHELDLMSINDPLDSNSAIYNPEYLDGRSVAEVIHNKIPSNAPRVLRMLTAVNPSQLLNLPETMDEAQLVIRDADYRKNPYTIVGFNPVALNGNNVGFRYDAGRDPYAKATTVLLPDAAVGRLLDVYRQAGLEKLSAEIEERPPKTVEDLRVLLKANARYAPGSSYQEVRMTSIRDVREYLAQDEILEYQCTGANQLLKLSLHELFPPVEARLITGITFESGEDYIDTVGHAQVMFQHDGSVYYLDATPGQSIGTEATNLTARSKNKLVQPRGLVKSAPKRLLSKSEEVKITPPAVVSTDIPTLQTLQARYYSNIIQEKRPIFTVANAEAELLQLNQQQVMPMLYAWEGVQPSDPQHKERFGRQMMRRNEHDPVRWIWHMAPSLAAGTMDKQELDQHQKFLRDLRINGSNPTLERMINVPTAQQLQAMESLVASAQHILQKIDKPC